MKGAKEFTGRSLDDAIAAACKYYDLPREKLEVEIMNDAKTGIFGLVGAKKATILAKQASVKNFDFENKEEKNWKHPKPSDKVSETSDQPAKTRDVEKPSPAQLPDKKDSADKSTASEEQHRADKVARQARAPRSQQASSQTTRDKRDDKDAPREGRTDRRARRFNGNGENNANTTPDPNGNVQSHARRPDDRNDRNDRRDRNRFPREGGDSRRNDSRRQNRDRNNIAPINPGNSLDYSDAEVQNQFTNSAEIKYSENADYLGAQQQKFQPDSQLLASQNNQSSTWSPPASGKSMDNLDKTQPSQPCYDQGDDFEPTQAAQNFANLDKEKACELVKLSLDKMVAAICSDANISVSVGEGRITASIDCGEASGLLIGREGQTLSALQYMVSRIISRQMEAAVHVHLDTGDYKERQDRKLKEISLRLAQRARESGRTQYTRPLSSYHRRIVHMVLQAEEGIETRSKGEGSMKRVYIFTRSN